jgi:uncharacterized membrane protein YhaH (DUF805 family)
MFDFTLHARTRFFFLFHKHIFVGFLFFSQHKKKKKKKQKNNGEDAEFLFFLLIAFQILHVFLPDISIHCALIKYACI